MDFIVDTDEEYFDYTNQRFFGGADLTQSRSITNGLLHQIHKLLAQNLANTSQVNEGIIKQIHKLLVQDLSRNSLISSGTISQIHKLLGENPIQQREVSSGMIRQIHKLTGQNLVSSRRVEELIFGEATHFHDVNLELSTPISNGVLTAISATSAEWS